MALPKKKHSIGLNIYYLGAYIRFKMASSEKLHLHAELSLKHQEDDIAYENQMLQGNMCPACHSDLGERG